MHMQLIQLTDRSQGIPDAHAAHQLTDRSQGIPDAHTAHPAYC